MQAFIERCNALVTCSKDGYVRAWDLATQHCFQITLGQQGEVRHLYHDTFAGIVLVPMRRTHSRTANVSLAGIALEAFSRCQPKTTFSSHFPHVQRVRDQCPELRRYGH